MPKTSYYLVDYENVGSDGFEGAEKLTNSDCVLIFYTNNARKIDLDVIAKCNNANMHMIKVPAGKQSADMHIGSYLGYLIGNDKKDSTFAIVSKDTDYDNIISFWNNGKSRKVCRINQISKSNQEIPKETTESKNVKDSYETILCKAGYSKDIITYVESVIVKNKCSKNSKQLIYRAIIKKYGQVKGLEIYTLIKKNI